MPGNVRIWTLLRLGATQWRTGVKSTPLEVKNRKGETIKMLMRSDTQYTGLDYNAAIGMAHGMDIPANQTFFENLNVFERVSLKHLNGVTNTNECSPDQKEKCTLEFGEEWINWACKECSKGNHGK